MAVVTVDSSMAIVTTDSSMAIVTTDSSSSPSSNQLHLESIPVIDMRFISQSELNSLSLCSDEAFDLRRLDEEIIIPKINRSVFNESAGSRKQTYSRIRLTPRKPEITSIGRRRRCSGILPVPKPEAAVDDDPETKENERIVGFLRKLFAKSKTHQTLINGENKELFDLNKAAVVENFPIGLEESEERGRKRKYSMEITNFGDGASVSGSSNGNRVMEIVNRNGVVVDIASLGNMVDPFGPELKRRTDGLETDAELLGFLRGLEGRWGSRRMKRKVVDASDFGDALPRGWKLLLSLKRKGGRVWVFCRRYISPNGQHFQTCKEVSSYLLSLFGPQNTSQLIALNSNEHIDGAYRLDSMAGFEREDDSRMDDHNYYSALPLAVLSPETGKQVVDRRVVNEESKGKDILECHKCNMSFDEKDEYLQHVLSSHPRSAKRCRLGSSVGDGVIIRDGKYECQFCHKVFNEKHSYNGHVGIHVRNYVKNFEASPRVIPMEKRAETPSVMQVTSGVLKANASGDIAMGYEMNHGSPQTDLDSGSIPETFSTREINEVKVGSPQSKQNSGSIPETSAAKSNHELNVDYPCSEQDIGSSKQQALITRSYTEVIMDSPHCESDADLAQENASAGANCETIVGSHDCEFNADSAQENASAGANCETKVGSPHCVFDADSAQENASAEANCETKVGSRHCEFDADLAEEIASAGPNCETKVGSPHTKLGTCHIPETVIDRSDCSLNIDITYKEEDIDIGLSVTPFLEKANQLTDGSPYTTHDPGDCEMHESLVNESHDKLESGFEMIADKYGKSDETNNNTSTDAISFLEPTPLSYKDEISSETSDKNVSISTCEDKPGLEEAGYKICSLTSWDNELTICEETSLSEDISSKQQETEFEKAKESGTNNPEIVFDNDHAGPDKHVAAEVVRETGEDTLQTVTADTSVQLMQSADCFSSLHIISDKGENEFYTINEKLENLSNFEEIRFEDVGPSQYAFVTGQESSPLAQGAMDLAAYDADLEQDLNPSVQFGSEAVLPALDNRQQLTTVCVWCSVEFNIEAINPEMQSDSVGFMCPNCKSKISAQLNVMENGLS